MKASKMLISTLKEAPQEAKISSHILLLRAGMIKNEVAGIYNFLPMGLRVLNKIEKIIEEEMDASGAQEILCSAIQPKELWEESGRWAKYGPELMRLKDRHDREFCLGPTHEEIFTSLVKDLVKSSKQLPITLYQIQTKYRDEFRPRFGLIRSREFIMKDAYSFDKDEKGLEASYQLMYDTYSRIFKRLHLNFCPVLADTGNIGGNGSHQFMALADVGESTIIYCDENHYAADQEKATSKLDDFVGKDEKEIEKVYTPNHGTIDELVAFLNEDPRMMSKTMVYHDFMNNKFILAMVRADKDINEIKLVNESNSNENYLKMASDEELESLGLIKGFIGPTNLPLKAKDIEIYVDEELVNHHGFLVGANEKNYHLTNVKFGRDFKGKVCDLRMAKKDSLCPICGKKMKEARGIEVGQVFKLQTKYSSAMKCTYTNEKGENIPMVMGCYGIGVTRTMASIIEQNHDENGIIWPLNVSPYHAVIICINYDDPIQKEVADTMYNKLKEKHVEVILDERDAKPGFKFKDWDLIGIPLIITVGRKASEGIVEFKERKENIKEEKNVQECLDYIVEKVQKEANF